MADDPARTTRKVVETAQKKVVASTVRQEKSELRQEDSADRRTELAADRTVLAGERTYAAWMRTGLTALAAGIGAGALLDGVVATWIAFATSIVLVLFAQFSFIAAVWREIDHGVPPPKPDVRRLPGWAMIGFSGFLVLVSGAVLVGLWSR